MLKANGYQTETSMMLPSNAHITAVDKQGKSEKEQNLSYLCCLGRKRSNNLETYYDTEAAKESNLLDCVRTANVFSGSTVRFRNLSFFGDYKFD